MPTQIGWGEISLRLVLTVVAGALIGINRGEHGRPAGLRTVLLVSLAACVSMIQVNLMLGTRGKTSDSFVVMDLMRLPLGILSGMGFIGAGAIIRRDSLVLGVTTAATLWFVTILGLCFGGGQLVLGMVVTALGFAVLCLLKPVEAWWKLDRQGNLAIVSGRNGPGEDDVLNAIIAAGFQVKSLSVTYEPGAAIRETQCSVKWRGHANEIKPPSFVARLAGAKDVLKISWSG